jgi:hypothetical protein
MACLKTHSHSPSSSSSSSSSSIFLRNFEHEDDDKDESNVAVFKQALKISRRGAEWAFTLLEVMIAVALFFMAAFSILALVSQNLRAARSLQTSHVTAAMLAADLSLTNRLEEGVESGEFGELYPGYSWVRAITEASSNGLFNVDFVVIKDGREDSKMSILLFRPNSIRQGGLRR